MTVIPAFSSMALNGHTAGELAAVAARLGYEGVELLWRDGSVLHDGMIRTELQAVAAAFEKRSVRVLAISGYTRYTGDGHGSVSMLDGLKRQLDAAAVMGAEGVRVFGGFVPAGTHTERLRYIEGLTGFLERAAGHAAGTGVRVLLATHDDFSTGSEVRPVLEGAGTAGIGVIWCVIHPIRRGEEPEATWEAIQDRVAVVHLKDALRGSAGEWQPLKPLGEGELPLERICGLLRCDGFTGPVSLEWEKHMQPEIEDSMRTLEGGIRYLKDRFFGEPATSSNTSIHSHHFKERA